MPRKKTGNQRGKTSSLREKTFPGVTHYRDRHNKLRWRYRSKGFTVNLGTEFGSEDFLRRYSAAVNGERLPQSGVTQRSTQAPQGSPVLKDGHHTLNSLITDWYSSSRYIQLGDSTKRDYRLVAENLRENHGHRSVEDITRGVVNRLLSKKADKPEAANKLLRILRLLLDHAVDHLEWIDTNPARAVKKFTPKNSEGYHTWTEDEIEKYFLHHKVGTVPDLAMVLMLYTGAARVDAVQLGPSNLSEDGKRIRYERQKMKTRNGVLVDIPVHPELIKRIKLVDPAKATFLETVQGTQRSPNGFGNAMRKWCDAVELSDCTAHGLRKACARRLAEAGATPHEIMAVTGHQTLAEVERYTKKVARVGLADSAMEKTR